jgi:NAD(P)-dependent dehydrogenase (short-subunit alcohol dehydrogenase family)
MTHFQGKVALVTGATSAIGRATAIAFGKQGATVVVTGRREKAGRETLDMLRAGGGDGAFIQLDVSVEGDVMGVVREIMSRYGRLDCAANCAGNDIVDPLTEYSEADYDAIFNPNVKGLFFCLKHEILAMRNNGGAIVNIGSIAAQLSDSGNSLYNASKSAAHSLTRTRGHRSRQVPHPRQRSSAWPHRNTHARRIFADGRGRGFPFQFRVHRREYTARPTW